MYKKYALDLHPDKGRVIYWLERNSIMDPMVQEQVEDHAHSFYNLLMSQKEKLVDFDEQLHTQASCGMVGDILIG